MTFAIINANEFKEFELRRDILKTKGIDLDCTVEPVEAGFKLVLNKEYDLEELDNLSEEVVK